MREETMGLDRRSGIDRRDEAFGQPEHDHRSVGRRIDDVVEAAAPVEPSPDEVGEGPPSRRKRLFEIMAIGRGGDHASKLFDLCLIGLISLNVLSVIFESVESIRDAYYDWFVAFELLSVAVFSVEYVLRVWTAVESASPHYQHPVWGRLRYMVSPMAIVDLLAVLPVYLGFVVDLDLRFMRVLRLLRILKLTRYSSAMGVLTDVFRQEAKAFGAALFVLVLLMIFSASMIYLFEHKAQPEAFANIPKAMWWSVITLTTVGYGDAYPVTLWGRLFGAAISVIGVGMVALPAGILSSGFSQQLRMRRERYQDKVQDALADGILTYEEAHELASIRSELGLSPEEARNILEHATRHGGGVIDHCPHCGGDLLGEPSGEPPPGRKD